MLFVKADSLGVIACVFDNGVDFVLFQPAHDFRRHAQHQGARRNTFPAGTTAPAPIMQFGPILLSITTAFMPISTLSPTTLPCTTAPWPTLTPEPITHGAP